jgi:allantoinase
VPRKPVKKSAAKARTKAAARATARKSAPLPPRVPTEHDRFDYSPIIDRPRLSWPNDARVAVWVIPNIEHFLFDRPSTRLTNLPVNPDVLNYSWRDYGVRVGIWRMMEVMERYGVKGTVALNSDVCARYPRIIEEGKKLGWEWMGHGNNNSTLFAGQSEAEERALIKDVVTTISKSVGKAPRGWLSPALSETMRTLDILAENGIEYVGNWVNDDQPYPMRVKKGSMIAMPYSVEINDIPALLDLHQSPENLRPDDLRPVRRALRGRCPDRPRDVDLPASVSGRLSAPEQILRQGAAPHHLAAGGVAHDRRRDCRLVQGEISQGLRLRRLSRLHGSGASPSVRLRPMMARRI